MPFDAGASSTAPGPASWPIQAENARSLERLLIQREHLLPLPKESALSQCPRVLIVDLSP